MAGGCPPEDWLSFMRRGLLIAAAFTAASSSDSAPDGEMEGAATPPSTPSRPSTDSRCLSALVCRTATPIARRMISVDGGAGGSAASSAGGGGAGPSVSPRPHGKEVLETQSI